MPTVARQVLEALVDRLGSINGQGNMVNDLQGRIYLQRFGYDVDIERTPAVFIARRVGGGVERNAQPGETTSDTTVVFDVVGVVERNGEAALAMEDLIGDLHRALEVADDPFLAECGRNLLNQELQLVTVETAPPVDGFGFDVVGVGVSCTWPHVYGDPDRVV